MNLSVGLGLARIGARDSGGAIVATYNAGDGAYTIHNGHPFLLKDGVVYGAPVRSDGSGHLRAFTLDLATEALDYAVVRTAADDSHTNGNVVIDPVNDRLSVMSTLHNTGSTVTLYRSTDLDVDNLTSAANATVTSPSYSSAFISPNDLNQLDVVTREGTASASSWRILRSENLDGAPPTFSEYELLSECYLDVREARSGSALYISTQGSTGAVSGHQDTTLVMCPSICLWKLDRATDELSSGGNVEAADITAHSEVHGHGWNLLSSSDSLADATVTAMTSPTTASTDDVWGGSGDTHRVIQCSGTGTHKYEQAFGTSVIGQHYQVDCLVKPKNTDRLMLAVTGGVVTAGTPLIYFDITNGTSTGGQNLVSSFMTALDNGWYHIGFTYLPDAAVTQTFRITPTRLADDTYANSYTTSGTPENIFLRATQACENPYSGLSLRAYSQNLGALNNPTEPPVVVYESAWGEQARLLSFEDTGTYTEFLFVVIQGYGGSFYADGTVGEVYWTRVHNTTDAVDTPVKVGDAGDGLNSTDDKSYLGGCIAGPLEVLYDRQNYQGNGKGQIVRATSDDEGVTWDVSVIKESATEVLMRPLVLKEQLYIGGSLTWEFSRYVAIMRGTYTNYTPGNFDTEVDILELVEQTLNPPEMITPPSIDNNAPGDVGVLLTATTGSYTNSPTSFVREWRRDNVAIAGETGLTYTTAEADRGTLLSFHEKALNTDGNSGFIRASTGLDRDLWFSSDSLFYDGSIEPWESSLQTAMGAGWNVTSNALSAINITTMESRAVSTIDPNLEAGHSVVVYHEYANTVVGIQGVETGAETYNQHRQYGLNRTAAGAGVVITSTCYYSGPAGATKDGTQAHIASELTRNNFADHADGFFDLDVPAYKANADANDEVHWDLPSNATLRTEVAELISAKIAELGELGNNGGIPVPLVLTRENLTTWQTGAEYVFDHVDELAAPRNSNFVQVIGGTGFTPGTWTASGTTLEDFNTGATYGLQNMWRIGVGWPTVAAVDTTGGIYLLDGDDDLHQCTLFANVLADVGGNRNGNGIRLYEAAGSVDVYLYDGITDSPPGGADRNIRVTYAQGDSQSTIASLVSAALVSDGAFWTNLISGSVYITEAASGVRTASSKVGNTYGFNVTTFVTGS